MHVEIFFKRANEFMTKGTVIIILSFGKGTSAERL